MENRMVQTDLVNPGFLQCFLELLQVSFSIVYSFSVRWRDGVLLNLTRHSRMVQVQARPVSALVRFGQLCLPCPFGSILTSAWPGTVHPHCSTWPSNSVVSRCFKTGMRAPGTWYAKPQIEVKGSQVKLRGNKHEKADDHHPAEAGQQPSAAGVWSLSRCCHSQWTWTTWEQVVKLSYASQYHVRDTLRFNYCRRRRLGFWLRLSLGLWFRPQTDIDSRGLA